MSISDWRYAINAHAAEVKRNMEKPMPADKKRRTRAKARVQTNLALSPRIRGLLEAAIDHITIHTLTDSIIDAVERREKAKKEIKS